MNNYTISLVCDNNEDILLVCRIINVRSSFIENIRSSLIQSQFRIEEAFRIDPDIEDEEDNIMEYNSPLMNHELCSPLLKMIKRQWCQLTIGDYNLIREWLEDDILSYIIVKGYINKEVSNNMPCVELDMLVTMNNHRLKARIYGYDCITELTVYNNHKNNVYITLYHLSQVYDEYYKKLMYIKTSHSYIIRETYSSHSNCNVSQSNIDPFDNYTYISP